MDNPPEKRGASPAAKRSTLAMQVIVGVWSGRVNRLLPFFPLMSDLLLCGTPVMID